MIKDYKHLIKLQHIHTEKNALKVCKSEMMIVKDLFLENYRGCLFYD